MSARDIDDLPHARGALQALELEKVYRGRAVLRGVTLTAEPGQVVAIEGPNGSGKTTLLNCLGLMEDGYGGSLMYGGEDLRAMGRRGRRSLLRQEFGHVFQNAGVVPEWSVEANVLLPLESRRMTRKEAKESAAEALDAVGLSGTGPLKAGALSGGEQQRLALARAMLKRSSVLLVDEPTSALDDAGSSLVAEYLTSAATAGAIVVLATHDPAIRSLADAVVHLKASPVAHEGR